MFIKFKTPLILCAVILLFSCAHQMAPGGGPDDTTGPLLLSETPSPESINVSPSTQIVFTFSEWISTGSDLSLSIFPPVKFKSKVSRNQLQINLLSKLSKSTTYHIVVNTALKDLHNNALSAPYNLIFSTGSFLDSGTISGCVIDPARKLLQPKIALFTPDQPADSGLPVPPLTFYNRQYRTF